MKEAFITLMILLVAIAVIFAVNSEPSKQWQLYNEQCINQGYHKVQFEYGSYYCIKFGNEPEIIKLEGVE